MPRRLALALTTLVLTLALISPQGTAAQVFYKDYRPGPEHTRVGGRYAFYNEGILRLEPNLYAVLYRPGFVDPTAALRAIAPLCAQRQMRAARLGPIAPVEIVRKTGEDRVLQGVRVRCLAP